MATHITVYELEILFRQALTYLRANSLDSQFSLDTDYYALLPTDKWEDMENLAKPEVVIGSLVDDVTELQRVATQTIPFTSVDLDRLASVLRALSQSISPI
ncbi:hypothetical protein [Hymenobacter sp. B81]|uniref:hypothetical protein n=1 Tax=Hymenobacter sp. B81 TaxID=3344878 RepID=UPI0037DDBADE